MRTAIIIVIGLVVLIALLLATRNGGRRTAARVALGFTVLWLIAALANAWLGVNSGYEWAEELPIAGIIFVIPAIPALIIWAKNRKAAPTA